MKKITELTEIKFRTKHYKDAFGNRIKDREEYLARRQVKTVSAGPRFGHYLVDSIIFQLIYSFIDFVLQLVIFNANIDVNTRLTISFLSVIFTLLLYPCLYFLCELKWQKTPGKFLTKTVVINEFAEKPSASELILRSIVRLVPFEAFSCLGDLSHGWHDRWSNTWVVSIEERDKLKLLIQEQSQENI